MRLPTARLSLLFPTLLIFAAVSTAACSRPPGLFSEPNARAHVNMLAGTIGSRPIGTPANLKARHYIVDQLRLYGYDVRVQDADARRAAIGLTARVSNIIAIRPGRRSESIGLLSHYDSVPAGPGAADDGLGVAVSLEAARVLAARADRNWSVMVLITDGEEAGLLGAHALVTDREVTSRLQAYVNIEAIGSAGTPLLFETGPGNSWLVKQWARHASNPRGASFGIEIYRRLPNDTDFSVVKRLGIPGLNFGATEDSYAYHTTRDTPERLASRTIRETGEQVVAVMTALDATDVTQRSDSSSTFFDVGRRFATSYGPRAALLFAITALVLGIIAWVRVTAAAIRLRGIAQWLLAIVWTILGSAAVVTSMIGATWALRHAREVYHPWYARPGRMFLLQLAIGFTVGWGVARLGQWLPQKLHGLRHPLMAWSITLPIWITLSAAMFSLAPGAAYLWVLPLLAAGVLLAFLPLHSIAGVRLASGVVLIVAAALWLQPATSLLYFIVATMGRLPIVSPSFVYAAVLTAAALMIVPPLLAAVTPIRPLLQPAIGTAAGLFAIAVTAGLAYMAPAYTNEEPLRRVARAFQDGDGAALWEVGSVEPGIDLGDGAPPGWRPAKDSPPTPVPIRGLAFPFVFRATGPTLGPPPVSIGALTLEPVQAGWELTVTVIPRMPGLGISFVLPAGVEPARSNLPGIVRDGGRWTATYLAPPAEGVVFRASFGGSDSSRIRDLRVMATASGPGDGSGWSLPPWLPQEHTAWTASASWVVAPFALPIAPVPPLR